MKKIIIHLVCASALLMSASAQAKLPQDNGHNGSNPFVILTKQIEINTDLILSNISRIESLEARADVFRSEIDALKIQADDLQQQIWDNDGDISTLETNLATTNIALGIVEAAAAANAAAILTKQAIVSGTCTPDQAIAVINLDGTVVCQDIPDTSSFLTATNKHSNTVIPARGTHTVQHCHVPGITLDLNPPQIGLVGLHLSNGACTLAEEILTGSLAFTVDRLAYDAITPTPVTMSCSSGILVSHSAVLPLPGQLSVISETTVGSSSYTWFVGNNHASTATFSADITCIDTPAP